MPDMRLELPVADDYAPSAGEVNNIVFVCCKYTVQWAMRQADLAVCTMMAGGLDSIRGDAGISKLVEVTCEYIWDHICGEPDDVTPEQFFEHLKPGLQEWYKSTTPEERAQIN